MILNLCSIVADLFKEKQVKRHRQPITASNSRKCNIKKCDVLLIEDDGNDVLVVDHVPTEETVIEIIEDGDVNMPIVDVIPINSFLPLFVLRGTIFRASTS